MRVLWSWKISIKLNSRINIGIQKHASAIFDVVDVWKSGNDDEKVEPPQHPPSPPNTTCFYMFTNGPLCWAIIDSLEMSCCLIIWFMINILITLIHCIRTPSGYPVQLWFHWLIKVLELFMATLVPLLSMYTKPPFQGSCLSMKMMRKFMECFLSSSGHSLS